MSDSGSKLPHGSGDGAGVKRRGDRHFGFEMVYEVRDDSLHGEEGALLLPTSSSSSTYILST